MSEWYLFALFIFLLAAALVWIIKRTPSALKKRDEKAFEREAKLFRLYQNIEDLMDGFEEYAEELKLSIRKDGDDLLRRVEALEAAVGALRKARVTQAPIRPAQEAKPITKPAPKAQAIAQAKAPSQSDAVKDRRDAPQNQSADVPLSRAQKVQLLSAAGLAVSDIAREMGLSQNEVALMLEVDNIAER